GSYWEIVIKTQKGLLSIDDLPTWWRRATDLTAARILPIRASHVTALAALPLLHKDPFDRILVAQAIAEGLPLVTNDGPIRAFSVRAIWYIPIERSIAVGLPPHRRLTARVERGDPAGGEHDRRRVDIQHPPRAVGVRHQLHMQPEPPVHGAALEDA